MARRAAKRRRNKSSKVLLLLIAFIITISASLAFFSDAIIAMITGTVGTLDIEIETPLSITRHYIVGTDEKIAVDGNITHINPGDILEVRYGIINEGNKSAWIREIARINIGLSTGTATEAEMLGIVRLYPLPVIPEDQNAEIVMANKREDIRNNAPHLVPLEVEGLISFEVAGEQHIINGTGTAAEIEVSGLNGTQYRGFLLYINPEAGAQFQNASIEMQITTQAMQYRNNPNPNWTDVVTEEFRLRRSTNTY